jgi:hypothetical protein
MVKVSSFSVSFGFLWKLTKTKLFLFAFAMSNQQNYVTIAYLYIGKVYCSPASPGEMRCLKVSTRIDATVTHKLVAKSSRTPNQRDMCKNIM